MMQRYLDRLPLVAILRGASPDEVVAIGHALVANGFSIIEVPLNSPDPIESIRRLAEALGPDILVGAGTVTGTGQVEQIARAGGRLVVMPHSDPEIVRAAKAAGMLCAPGVSTPTEGFSALKNGADALKLFPAEAITPAVLKAWASVFPAGTRLLPVGGITPSAMEPYVRAGASGFGLGSALYKPGVDAHVVGQNAAVFAAAWRRMQTKAV
ncbi:2-dehydro-3-deoxy-6-phosphogalactonate aldolase [Cupriavidus sp. NPDC089707]|uniref:2-dehydro-3-deoxy-6-phosphogalactonate aldolase n=1 Tax=Cupriavidus sp. NPDC089707 TaxID=3363963 RepID=UPI00381D57E0